MTKDSNLAIFSGQKLKELRTNRGWTQNDLGERLQLKATAIGNYERGERPLNQDILFKLSDIFGVSINYFFPTTVSKTEIQNIYDQLNSERQTKVYNFAEAQLEEQNKVVSIAESQTVYLNSKLSAGTGILDLDPSDTKEIEYKGYVPKHDLAFVVSGDSMEPAFADGEVVFVEKTPDIHNGQFIAVQINEEAYIKKVYKEDDCLRLVSLNKEYDDIVASKDDDIRVIGRVIL